MIAQLTENVRSIQEKIASAAQRSGRTSSDVTLVAVTKYVSDAVTRALVRAGCQDLGESRPQTLWSKAAALADLPIRWHMVGHLQRNKVERTLPIVSLLHSGDRMHLLRDVDRAAARQGLRVRVLLEINISGDATKHGFAPDEMESHLPAIAALEHLEIRGLMGMASLEGDVSQARREFASLRALRDRLQRNAPASWRLDELSMGMSGDFEHAIAEGATLVRVGSALFDGVPLDAPHGDVPQ